MINRGRTILKIVMAGLDPANRPQIVMAGLDPATQPRGVRRAKRTSRQAAPR